MVRYPKASDFDLVRLEECSLCGNADRLIIHHEVPISFKWVPEFLHEILGEVSQEEFEETLFKVESRLKQKYFSRENRIVICWKCQHGSFHTYTMCHHCVKHPTPAAYNSCARCFEQSVKQRVRDNKVREMERTIQAIRDAMD